MMKMKLLLPLVAIALGLGAMSCNDDDEDITIEEVPEDVQTTLNQMFPKAQKVEWDNIPPYYVADFTLNGFSTEAWFGISGQWAMTETDYNNNVTYLPAEVQTAFAKSEYANWVVDDVEAYERTYDSFNVIEVEMAGKPDVSLFYSNDGVLLNTVPGFDITITPATVISSLN